MSARHPTLPLLSEDASRVRAACAQRLAGVAYGFGYWFSYRRA